MRRIRLSTSSRRESERARDLPPGARASRADEATSTRIARLTLPWWRLWICTIALSGAFAAEATAQMRHYAGGGAPKLAGPFAAIP